MKLADRVAIVVLMSVSVFANMRIVAAPPNLIVILTDDQGYHDVGFNGSKDLLTPNLDSIASNGVRFTSGYISSPFSSPSRAGLMTGRYQERFGLERDFLWLPNRPDAGLPLKETTLAEALGQVGYECGMIGKWHLGRNPQFQPLKRGFNEFFGFLGAGHLFLPEELTIDDPRKVKTDDESWRLWVMRDDTTVKTTNYLTDEFSDEAVRFIARHKDKPFYLLIAYNAPHGPLEALEHGQFEAPEKYLSRFKKIAGPSRRTYAAMMSSVDDGVGGVLAELRKNGLVEQTIVVYLSASGGSLDANSSDNYPLRGSKNYSWEGGWRVPFAMQWPGHLPKGTVYDQPVLSLDIFATAVALADAPINPERPLDGLNLFPFLTRQKSGAPHEAIFSRMADRGAYSVRSGDYKLVVTAPDLPPELYKVTDDIGELNNLAPVKPEIVKELQEKYANWSKQMKPGNATKIKAPLPTQPNDTETINPINGR